VEASKEAGMEKSSRAEWRTRVRRWEESGLTAREFAAETGINPRTLAYWKWRLRKDATEAAGARTTPASARVSALSFVEVHAEPVRVEADAASLELVVGRRYRLALGHGFDAEVLARVLDVLDARVDAGRAQ
jgi:hypothetical protein